MLRRKKKNQPAPPDAAQTAVMDPVPADPQVVGGPVTAEEPAVAAEPPGVAAEASAASSVAPTDRVQESAPGGMAIAFAEAPEAPAAPAAPPAEESLPADIAPESAAAT
ncbi:MAG: hypothetical protein LC749_14920, partial [Actinobacteria bacterium]|nr:hypothetical protein [Actinomycetota bacterium]